MQNVGNFNARHIYVSVGRWVGFIVEKTDLGYIHWFYICFGLSACFSEVSGRKWLKSFARVWKESRVAVIAPWSKSGAVIKWLSTSNPGKAPYHFWPLTSLNFLSTFTLVFLLLPSPSKFPTSQFSTKSQLYILSNTKSWVRYGNVGEVKHI